MAESSLDASLDRLYQVPLEEFVAARQELARQSSREDARLVRDLPKPNLAAWALNQLYWSARAAFDRLVRATARAREAQAKALLREEHDFPAAEAAQREALAAAVREASAILEAAGHAAGADALRAITAALAALPWKEPPGRLARPPVPSGFGVLAGLPTPPQLPEPTPRRPASGSPKLTLVPPPSTRPSPRAGSAPKSPAPAPPPAGRRSPSRSGATRPAPSSHEKLRAEGEAPDRQDASPTDREQRARDALDAARAEAAAAGRRLRESRTQLAEAEDVQRQARAALEEATRSVAAAASVKRAAERADATARAALRKAEAAAHGTKSRGR